MGVDVILYQSIDASQEREPKVTRQSEFQKAKTLDDQISLLMLTNQFFFLRMYNPLQVNQSTTAESYCLMVPGLPSLPFTRVTGPHFQIVGTPYSDAKPLFQPHWPSSPHTLPFQRCCQSAPSVCLIIEFNPSPESSQLFSSWVILPCPPCSLVPFGWKFITYQLLNDISVSI